MQQFSATMLYGYYHNNGPYEPWKKSPEKEAQKNKHTKEKNPRKKSTEKIKINLNT